MVQKKKVGLTLGSGGARGSAHVGVLKVLEENKIRPDVIVGTSMGAEVGGAYAAGIEVDELAAIWQSITFGRVVKTLLPTIPWSGWSSGGEVLRTVRRLVGDLTIEELPLTYAAVATDLQTGLPYIITEGSLAQAIRASLSVPGLFTPVWIDGHLLIDGGVSERNAPILPECLYRSVSDVDRLPKTHQRVILAGPSTRCPNSSGLLPHPSLLQ